MGTYGYGSSFIGCGDCSEEELAAGVVEWGESDFAEPGTQYSVGVSPCEIDLLTSVPGLEFVDCWESHVVSSEGDFPIPYLGKPDLVTAKKTAGRPQDLADLDELRRADC